MISSDDAANVVQLTLLKVPSIIPFFLYIYLQILHFLWGKPQEHLTEIMQMQLYIYYPHIYTWLQ